MSHGSDDVPQKKEIVKYSQCHKSLMQACTKLQQSLVKQSASVQNKRARDKKAEVRKLANEKKLEAQRCAALEDEQQGIRGLPCFEHVPDLESAPAESSKPHLDLDGVDSIDISGEEFSCCTVAAPDSQGVFLPLVEIQKAAQEATADEESEAASASASKAAAKQTWHKLDFEEWDQWLDARVSNGSAAVLLDKMNWATKKYLMLPEHRCKALDNALSATVHLCPSESLYIGLTPMGWPHLQLQLQGRRYVFAVPVNDLSKLYSEQQNKQPGDLVELLQLSPGAQQRRNSTGQWGLVCSSAQHGRLHSCRLGICCRRHQWFGFGAHAFRHGQPPPRNESREDAGSHAANQRDRCHEGVEQKFAGRYASEGQDSREQQACNSHCHCSPCKQAIAHPRCATSKSANPSQRRRNPIATRCRPGLEELAPTAAEDMDAQNMLDEIETRQQ